MCAVCVHSATEKGFEKYLMDAIERIRLNIPNVIVNILDQFNVSRIYGLTKGQTAYCTKLGILPNFECECAFLEGYYFIIYHLILYLIFNFIFNIFLFLKHVNIDH